MTSVQPSPNPVELFMKSWQVYQEIIRHNYMFHLEISTEVSASLAHFRQGASISVMDLGCGDASMSLPLLPRNRVQNYLGCDLSQAALDIAAGQLETLKISHELICDDMLRVAKKQPPNSHDVIISSYAIHHLDTSQKMQLLEAIAAALTPGGAFVLIDIFRELNESRSDYIAHYMGFLKTHWIALSEDAQSLIVDHATTFDFPEHPEFFDRLCQNHGFAQGKQLAKHTWHQAWLYSKLTPT